MGVSCMLRDPLVIEELVLRLSVHGLHSRTLACLAAAFPDPWIGAWYRSKNTTPSRFANDEVVFLYKSNVVQWVLCVSKLVCVIAHVIPYQC